MRQRRQRLYRFVPFSAAEDEQDGEAKASEQTATARAVSVQPPGYATPEAANPAEVVAERDLVAWTLAQEPETLRVPLVLSIVVGCSHTEIARILDLQEATVRQRISRARKAFQALYTRASGEEIRVDAQDQRTPIRSQEGLRPAPGWQTAPR